MAAVDRLPPYPRYLPPYRQFSTGTTDPIEDMIIYKKVYFKLKGNLDNQIYRQKNNIFGDWKVYFTDSGIYFTNIKDSNIHLSLHSPFKFKQVDNSGNILTYPFYQEDRMHFKEGGKKIKLNLVFDGMSELKFVTRPIEQDRNRIPMLNTLLEDLEDRLSSESLNKAYFDINLSRERKRIIKKQEERAKKVKDLLARADSDSDSGSSFYEALAREVNTFTRLAQEQAAQASVAQAIQAVQALVAQAIQAAQAAKFQAAYAAAIAVAVSLSPATQEAAQAAAQEAAQEAAQAAAQAAAKAAQEAAQAAQAAKEVALKIREQARAVVGTGGAGEAAEEAAQAAAQAAQAAAQAAQEAAQAAQEAAQAAQAAQAHARAVAQAAPAPARGMDVERKYYEKYLKYKNKYLKLKKND
jgi:hypothetical protein